MSDATENISIASPILTGRRFFQRTDWRSFWLTTLLMLLGYLVTLAPDVTLEFSGVFSTGANYAGVPHPPGFPLWTIYAWLFTKLLPFSNIAWRLAVSSAVAGSLACGIIALIVSRSGALILESVSGFRRLQPKQETRLRLVCGAVAGMTFGFDSAFWSQAVIVEVFALGAALFGLTICFFMRWFFVPERMKYFYAAVFVYGLALTNNQFVIVAVLGLPFLVMFGDKGLARDLFLGISLLAAICGVILCFTSAGWPCSFGGSIIFLRIFYFVVAAIAAGVSAMLIVKTRAVLTRWKALLLAGGIFSFALMLYFYLPIASMTNPPVNWGYPRTADGFVHVLSRGQYERIFPTTSLFRYVRQLIQYIVEVGSDFGWIYFVPLTLPFGMIHRMRERERGWVLGLGVVYFCLSFLLLAFLNPPPDRAALNLMRVFFSPSHLVLAIWTGCGLILLGTILARPRSES